MTRDTLDMFQQPDRGRFGDNETQPRPGNGPKVTGSSRLVDLDMVRHNDVIMPASILCSLEGSRTKAVVLPKSQIKSRGYRPGRTQGAELLRSERAGDAAALAGGGEGVGVMLPCNDAIAFVFGREFGNLGEGWGHAD